MSDYNDGKIHGWNGGECPVHPKSVVDIWDAQGWAQDRPAESVLWGEHEHRIAAFRVVKAYREQREWWATGRHLHDSPEAAQAFIAQLAKDNPGRGYESIPIIHVREVLE